MRQQKQPKEHRPKKTLHGLCGKPWKEHSIQPAKGGRLVWVCPTVYIPKNEISDRRQPR